MIILVVCMYAHVVLSTLWQCCVLLYSNKMLFFCLYEAVVCELYSNISLVSAGKGDATANPSIYPFMAWNCCIKTVEVYGG